MHTGCSVTGGSSVKNINPFLIYCVNDVITESNISIIIIIKRVVTLLTCFERTSLYRIRSFLNKMKIQLNRLK